MEANLAPAGNPAEAIYSNSFLREILLSLRFVAGPSYGAILHEAGLDPYRDALPPSDSQLTVTADTITRLFSGGYTHLAPPQAMLFFNYMGEHLANVTWERPELQNVVPEIGALAPGARVVTAWKRLIEFVNRDAHLRRRVVSDDRNDYLILENCPYCQGIHNAPRPVCFATVRYYEVLLLRLTGRAVVVRELECHATGHNRCVFAVRRERGLSGTQ